MTEPRFILEPYKGMATRHKCPACQHRTKTFSLYFDKETNAPLHYLSGRCERIDKCGYHYTPKQYFADKGIVPDANMNSRPFRSKVNIPISYIDGNVFKSSLAKYDTNHFVSFLNLHFDNYTVENLITKYFIGSSKHWKGSTVFWQVDVSGNIRCGKIMLYSPSTGRRVKHPYNHITWAHSALQLPDYNLKQCLFGEHLLITNNKPVAIVESEKTALIASVFLPELNWLACGSLQNLSSERCEVLEGRSTILYPDLNAFDKWSIKSQELGFSISSVLEDVATHTEREDGLDLADFLLNSVQNSKY
jgi:hypothetical protein